MEQPKKWEGLAYGSWLDGGETITDRCWLTRHGVPILSKFPIGEDLKHVRQIRVRVTIEPIAEQGGEHDRTV